ncbi:MAG: hypothetical protein M1541_00985 [Acidobacteria bacterium]|nr:hypothetical protein [Acidobacteriota bacterium]
MRLILAVIWLLGTGLHAATLEKLTLDDMIQKSTDIVRAKVGSSYAAFRGSIIYTNFKIQVLERWKGTDQPAMEVSVPGGIAGGLRQSFAGVPQLIDGKEYLLFLWKGKTGGTQVIGFTQGVFQLPNGSSAESTAVRAATTETMLEPGTGRVIKDERIEMRLQDLRTQITKTLAKGTTK